MHTKIKIFLYIFLLLCTGTSSFAVERVAGSLICQVKSNFVIEIENGEAKTFEGFEGQTKVGEFLTFEYLGHKNIFLSLTDEFNNLTYFSQLFPSQDLIWGHGWPGLLSGYIEPLPDMITRIIISDNRVTIQDYEKSLLLKKYDDQKYDGIFSRLWYDNRQAHVLSLDCRTRGDSLAKFSEFYD